STAAARGRRRGRGEPARQAPPGGLPPDRRVPPGPVRDAGAEPAPEGVPAVPAERAARHGPLSGGAAPPGAGPADRGTLGTGGGEMTAVETPAKLKVVNPATGELITTVPATGAEDVTKAAER